uniref:Uncharacterized protein n=1 Tax=Octactis speculum TaxID=3111310 RepID=A0A7S2FZ27_9STRA|mmetsp:Transcript_34310/g.46390  ORF Transcript_34310/g.46390 Transcript_34310/m.46390 type:complete len:204 (+) Transcript_34310:270-881(+)
MIPHDDQPRACGSAAQLQETLRRSRSNIPSRVFIVILAAAAMPAAAIDDRFRMDCAKVAPSIQFLQTGTSIFGTNDGVVSSSGLAPRRRQSSVASALAPRRGPGRLDASAAESFAASYFSTYSSPIASGLITWKSAIFDKRLITSSSKVSQNRIVGGDIEEIEGGGDRRPQHKRCRVGIQRLPLLHALLHGRPAGLHTLLALV